MIAAYAAITSGDDRTTVPVLTWIKAVEFGHRTRWVPAFWDMGTLMDNTLKSKILELLDQHRLMTMATNRPDGWPQATTVGYVNDGLTIYFLCSPQSQKGGKPRAG